MVKVSVPLRGMIMSKDLSLCRSCVWSGRKDVGVCHRRSCFYELDRNVLCSRMFRERNRLESLQSLQTLQTEPDGCVF